jgi:hypothetical protein
MYCAILLKLDQGVQMKQVYPHLNVLLDREPFFADLVKEAEAAEFGAARLKVRDKMLERDEAIVKWFTDHGYRCGNDYFDSGDTYRFANNGLAVAFALVWAR